MTPKFMRQSHAEDCILRHRYLYYVLGKPVLSDYEYDQLELAALMAYPRSTILTSVGSSNAGDYPAYVIDGRWPSFDERVRRDIAYIR